MPTPGQLRRERRALLRVREERIRDLGGLMLEMYKRNEFRQNLVFEGCDELVGIEGRLAELDSLLAAAAVAPRGGPASKCVCGAPIIFGSHFCANCGRPVGASPVVACSQCGNPLPADVRFCGNCGSPTSNPGADRPSASSSRSEEDTAPEPAPDSWER